MAFGKPSWVAAHLLGPDHPDLSRIHRVRVEQLTYGSTAGPFPGIGGAAVTPWTITELGYGELSVYFADGLFLGWDCGHDRTSLWANKPRQQDLRDATACPVRIPEECLR